MVRNRELESTWREVPTGGFKCTGANGGAVAISRRIITDVEIERRGQTAFVEGMPSLLR